MAVEQIDRKTSLKVWLRLYLLKACVTFPKYSVKDFFFMFTQCCLTKKNTILNQFTRQIMYYTGVVAHFKRKTTIQWNKKGVNR